MIQPMQDVRFVQDPYSLKPEDQPELNITKPVCKFVWGEIFSTLLTHENSIRGFKTLLHARAVCKDWQDGISQTFLHNASIASALGLRALLYHKKNQTEDTIVHIPPYLSNCPLFADMFPDKTKPLYTYIDQGLQHSLETSTTDLKIRIIINYLRLNHATTFLDLEECSLFIKNPFSILYNLGYIIPLLSNKHLAFSILSNFGYGISFMPQEICSDSDCAFAAVSSFGPALQYVDPIFQQKKIYVISAVRRDGLTLAFASPACRDDKEIVLIAVENDGAALMFASDRLKADQEVVLKAIEQTGSALAYAADTIKADKNIILKAVQFKNKESALQFASSALQDDEDIVSVAVLNKHNIALQHASLRLRSTESIVLAAIRTNPKSFWHASFLLRGNRTIVMAAYQSGKFPLQLLPPQFQEDPEIVLLAITKNPHLFSKDLPLSIRANRTIALEAVRGYGLNLAHVAKEFLSDKEVVHVAVKSNGRALQYASKELQGNRAIVETAFRNDPNTLYFASPELQFKLRL